MSTGASVVVVGAGIIGCSVAYHLAARGVRSIIVLERERIGRGSTADAAGGIRLQFSNEVNIRLVQRSLDTWEHFQEVFGVDIGLRQQGYLFLLSSPAEVEEFRESLALQQRLGVPARWVTPDEILELNPALRVDDLLGGTFCPRDGWADPYSSAMGFARAARQLGVDIREATPAARLIMDGDTVRGVATDRETIEAEHVVLCAGVHSPALAATARLNMPILPYRRMTFVTAPFDAVPATIPMTVEFGTSLYVHPEGRGFLFGMANPNEPSSFTKTVDDGWMLTTLEALCRRAPVFERAEVLRGWAGLYEVTPDDNPLLGFVNDVGGLLVAAGFSGHGYMQAPAVGECIADLIINGQPRTIDISSFAPSRFQRGELHYERNVI